MPYIETHGGHCCGIRHIHAFETYYSDDAARLRRLVNNYKNESGDACFLLEVVTADFQEKEWPQLVEDLKELRFRVVSKFRNANTGNIIRVWHRYTNLKGD